MTGIPPGNDFVGRETLVLTSAALPERPSGCRDNQYMRRREFLAVTFFDYLLPWRWFRRGPEIAGIPFREVRKGHRRTFLWIHGNEQTAAEVLDQHMKDNTGRAFFVQSKERNVPFLGGKIDPNRMWSRAGAEKNLKSLNPSWTPEQINKALNKLDKDRQGFLKRLLPSPGRVLVALHNNGPSYSVKDEVPISDLVAMNDPDHPDEFMLCTMRPDFDLLAGGPYNVVLQQEAPKEDDGSLSRLCAARKVRYVNVEAAMGNAEAQRKMLDWVELIL